MRSLIAVLVACLALARKPAAAAVAGAASQEAANKQLPPLIPLQLLYGTSNYTSPQVSEPENATLAFLRLQIRCHTPTYTHATGSPLHTGV